MSISFADIPDAIFCDDNTQTIYDGMVTLYQKNALRVLYPGDPMRIFLITIAAAIAQQRTIINYTGQQNLLRYAAGPFLDNLGAMVDVVRLPATPSHATMQFTIQVPLTFTFAIPAGTRTTFDGITYFATDADAVFPIGAITLNIPSSCQVSGTATNGLAIGQINRLVDPLPYVISVANIDVSSGGADVEADDALRTRIGLAPESFSTAGAMLAYKFFGLSAHPNILDVSVTSPVPGVVTLFVLLQGGVIPDINAPELALVLAACSPKNRRPLTDYVAVFPATPEPIAPVLTWFITDDQTTDQATIASRVQQACDMYTTWQIQKIGRDIITQKLIRLVIGAGAKRCEITGISDQVLDDTQVAVFTAPIQIIYGGNEPQ